MATALWSSRVDANRMSAFSSSGGGGEHAGDDNVDIESLSSSCNSVELGSILWNRFGRNLRIKHNLLKFKFVISTSS
jgi:hypothetical protein